MRIDKAVLLGILFLAGCSGDEIVNNYYNDDTPGKLVDYSAFQTDVKKWYNGHTAALCINYDARYRGVGRDDKIDQSIDEVVNRGLIMDFELVTDNYVEYPDIVDQMHNVLAPQGIGFFAHGHKHDNHDHFDFDYCYNSFKTCYDYMTLWGITPKTYAYPHWAGRNPTTQLANELAGYIAARGRAANPDSMLICPGDVKEPDNWYYLPSASMAYQFQDYLSDHEALSPVLVAAVLNTAWVIVTYHSIGYPDGWGYYPFEEFTDDLDLMISLDFWCGHMDDVACYVMERNNFRIDRTLIKSSEEMLIYTIYFRDGLDNDTFNQPLTVDFTFEPAEQIKRAEFIPALNSESIYTVNDDSLRINLIPDERKYIMTLYK